MKSDSEYFFYDKKGNNKLYVWFSSIDVPKNRFEMFKTMSSIKDSDVLFLNCKNNSYYIEGVPGLGNFTKTIEYLKSLVAGYDSVMFLGNSMGAYGALLYGLFLNVNHIIAYGPELQLGIKGGKYNAENKRVGYHLYNICQLLSAHKPTGNIHILVGEKAYYDMMGITSLPKMNNLYLYSIANAYHSLIGVFQQDINSHIGLVEESELITYSGLGTLVDYPEVISWLYSKTQSPVNSSQELVTCIDFYESNKLRLGYLNGYVALVIAKSCQSLGEKKLQEKYLRQSIKYNWRDVECCSAAKRLMPNMWNEMVKKYPLSSIKDDRLMTQIAYKKFYETLLN